ncbi:uncharacterized protein [Scyliorhinus torazame]|uniref:ATP synthase membrane subunit f n=2 Tax=Scyliorhinus torazame TaxID=75743 RepID=A0A401NN87_SCYTO|nr:hypothetical protein [Scyliorhinus torazame]
MEHTSPGMQVCPFCGKAFKRLNAHLPHCKMARSVNGKSNSKEADTPIAIPQLELNCKSIRFPASPSKKMKVKTNSAKPVMQKEQAASTKKQNNSMGLENESWNSEQTARRKSFNESQSSQGDLMDNREQIKEKDQKSVSRTTKGRPKEAKKEMVIKTKSSEHFLKRDQDKVDLKLKSATRAKVTITQKIESHNSIKKEENNGGACSSRLPPNEKQCADLISKNIFSPKVKAVLKSEDIRTRPEFEKGTAVLDLQAHVIVPQSSCAVKTNSLHIVRRENVVPPVDIRCPTDQNEVTGGMVSNELIFEQSPITYIKTSVWHHIKDNFCAAATSAKQDFIMKVDTSVKEDDHGADVLETDHCNSFIKNHICSKIMASMRVKDLNKYEGNSRNDCVAVKKIGPCDWNTNGAVQSEYLHLLHKENGWDKCMFLSTSSRKTMRLAGRIKEPHTSLCTKTEIGMEWFPELYPGYHSIGLSMLPEQTKQLETSIRISASQCENTKGYRKHYNKYINARRGGVRDVITLLLGCATFSYIWNYYYQK